MPDRPTLGDPTPRTIESLTQAVKSVIDQMNLQFDAVKEATKLLQDRSDRQPSIEAVNGDLKALKELTASERRSLEKLVKANFAGNKTALDAALKTQEKALDEIKISFSKQFDNMQIMLNDMKDRINRSEGRTAGLSTAGAIGLGVCTVIVALVVVSGFIIAQT